jgi:uncharacterized damage-inducible protein DinB
MAFTFTDLIDSLRASRSHFYKHIEGVRDDQWDWKPYAECKSIRETLIHLLVDDRVAVWAFDNQGEPDYEAFVATAAQEADRDLILLQALLHTSFTNLLEQLTIRYAHLPIDTEINTFGSPRKLGVAIPFFSSEDYYHAGQIAFIRMATDSDWNTMPLFTASKSRDGLARPG